MKTLILDHGWDIICNDSDTFRLTHYNDEIGRDFELILSNDKCRELIKFLVNNI